MQPSTKKGEDVSSFCGNIQDTLEKGQSQKNDDFFEYWIQSKSSIEESDNFSSNVSLPALLMSKDTLSGGKDQMSELPGGKNVVGPFFEIGHKNIVIGWNDSTFVDSSNKFNDNFLAPVIINDLKFSNVVVLLHNPQEFNQDLGDRLQEHLLLSLALCIDDRAKGVWEDVDLDHFVD